MAEGATRIYYSVGTNTAALYNANASASNGVLSLATAASDNISVGDEIRQSTNRYYITGRNSDQSFNIQDSGATGTPGDPNITFGSQSITIYRAFNALDNAVDVTNAGADEAAYLGTADLTTTTGNGPYQLNLACYGDGSADTTWASLTGWTTSATSYIRIYTPVSSTEAE
jgi:hypothetical protein